MGKERRALQVTVRLAPPEGADRWELRELTDDVRATLERLEVESVEPASAGPPPPGAMGDPVTLGTLLVTLAASGGVLAALIKAVEAWVTRHERCQITLEVDGRKLDVKGASPEERHRLIELWTAKALGPEK